MSKTGGATLVIAVFFVLSKILGLLRILVLGNRFGAGEEIDIFVAALRIPDLLFNLLVLGTLSAAFIPVFIEYAQKDKPQAREIASTVFNTVVVVMAVFSFLGIVFASPLSRIIAPGFEEAARAQTAMMMRILMLSPFLFSVSSVLTSILHSHKRFVLAAAAPLFYNIAIILGVIYLVPKIGIQGLAWGAVGGAFLHFLIQFPSVLKLRLLSLQIWNIHNQGIKKIGRLFLPRVLGIDIGQVNLFITSIIGSTLGAGSIAIIYFAYDINTVPLGVFAISFAIASFPTFAEYAGKKDLTGFRQYFSRTAVQILFFIIPFSVLFLLLRAQIVRLIPGALEGTRFDFQATRLTAQALGFFSLSLFAQGLIPLMARAFYALQNTVIPVVAGLVSAAINIGLAVWFTSVAGPDTMALAFSVAVIINMLILFVLLYRRVGGFEDQFLFIRVIKICVASIVMGIAMFITLYTVAPVVDMTTYLGILIQATVAAVVGLAAYFVMGLIIKLPETYNIVKLIRIWATKLTRPITSVIVSMFTDVS